MTEKENSDMPVGSGVTSGKGTQDQPASVPVKTEAESTQEATEAKVPGPIADDESNTEEQNSLKQQVQSEDLDDAKGATQPKSIPLGKLALGAADASGFDEADGSFDVDTSFDGPRRAGLVILFIVFGVFGVWSALAPIDGAALAPGQVAVKSHKKTVQHLEGGIVKEIRVRNGDLVQEDDILLVMDDTQSLGQLEIFKGQFLALKAKESRLLAERDGLDSVIYDKVVKIDDVRADEEIASQNQIFLARKNAREGSMDVLRQRVEQLQTKKSGLESLKNTKQELARSYKEELADFSDLLQDGFTDKNRLRELERNFARLNGEVAELVSSISGTEIQIGETRLQILQEEKEFRTAVVDELGENQTSLFDIEERLRVVEDTVSRTLVRAPESGVIHGLEIHTLGAVIGPGTPIADIVPQTEELVIDAKVSTIDIDRVAVGQNAKIRFSAFNSAVPSIEGVLLSVSADSLVDEATGMTYYSARVEVTKEGMRELQNLELVPGMPAEVYITTGSRTLFQYLMQPISNSLARSLIED